MSSGPPSSSEPSSRWIWPFELKERIGEGGMGVVYRARYVVNNREVAVKMLPSDVKNPVVLARFERELDVLKTLRHPNVVRSFGGVCDNKQRFYAMELVEGGTLEDELQERGRLPWEQVVEYGQEMCAALAYLHQHGVVHRDIKPANFLIGKDKQLKLSDFGLASVAAARRITTAGKTAGTILYMAPEQIRGGEITPQTDLYALGCVLYELLTGSPPYVGSTPASTMNMHCHEPIPRVTQEALDCPVALERLIQHLLAKDPKDRPPDAAAVARELSLVTGTVTVLTKHGPLDSDDFRLESSPKPETLDTRFKETRALQRDDSSRPWPMVASMIVITILAASVVKLWQAGQRAQESEALWIEAAHSRDRTVSLHALKSLGKLQTASPALVEAVGRNLSSESPEVRAAAAAALGQWGPLAHSKTAQLYKLQKTDPSDEVRDKARIAIQKIQQDQRPAGPGWLAYLSGLVLVTAAGLILARKQLCSLAAPPSVGRRPVVSTR